MTLKLRRQLSDRPLATFFILTYVLSWTAWSPLVVRDWWAMWIPVITADDLQTLLLIVVGGFGPLVAAATVTWIAGGRIRKWAGQVLQWRVPIQYWLFALLFPAVAIVTASAIHIVAFDGQFEPESTTRVALYPVLFLQVFLVGGGNEELGWRGFALPRLQARYSALTASLIIDIAWFAWHLPLFVVAGSSQVGVPLHYYGVAVVEELGWRGIVLPELQKHYSALTTSLVIGVFWSLWHLPLFWTREPLYVNTSFSLYIACHSPCRLAYLDL
jgi:membrane protease YdiL (CAAX protease family)